MILGNGKMLTIKLSELKTLTSPVLAVYHCLTLPTVQQAPHALDVAPGGRHVERRLLLLVVEVEAGPGLAQHLHDPGEAVPGGDVKAGLLVLQ